MGKENGVMEAHVLDSIPFLGPGQASPAAVKLFVDSQGTGHKGTVTVSVPGEPRQWAAVNTKVQRKGGGDENLQALPVGLASTWC